MGSKQAYALTAHSDAPPFRAERLTQKTGGGVSVYHNGERNVKVTIQGEGLEAKRILNNVTEWLREQTPK